MKFYNDYKRIYKVPNEDKVRIATLIFILCLFLFIILITELILWNQNNKYKTKLEPIGYTVFVSLTCLFIIYILLVRNVDLFESPNTEGRKFNLYKDIKSNFIIWLFSSMLIFLFLMDIWLGKKTLKGIKFSIGPFFILIFIILIGLYHLRIVIKKDLTYEPATNRAPSVINNKLRNMESEIYGNAIGIEEAIKQAQDDVVDEDKKQEILEKVLSLNSAEKENFISNPTLEEIEIKNLKEFNINKYFSIKQPDPELEIQNEDIIDDEKEQHIKNLSKNGYKKN